MLLRTAGNCAINHDEPAPAHNPATPHPPELSGGRGSYARPMGAETASVSFDRSCGESSTSRPRRPAETQIVSWAFADASSTVRSLLRWPSGEMPPRTYPVVR